MIEEGDGLEHLRERAEEIAGAAFDRGREQGAALVAFLEGKIDEDFDAVNEGLDRDLARRAIYMFTLGLLQALEDSDRVDIDLAVMAAQQAVDEVDENDVSMEYRDEPYAIGLNDDPEFGDAGERDTDLAAEMEAMRLRAAGMGASVCGDLNGVGCLVTASGEWHVGFETPDDYCVAREDLLGERGEVLAATYLHWIVDHFQPIFALCTTEMRERTGAQSAFAGIFHAADFYDARSDYGESDDDEATVVSPVDISEVGYVESSRHVFHEGDAPHVAARFYKVVCEGATFCGILELYDAKGRVTEQLNLFVFPKLEPGDEMSDEVDDRLDGLAERSAAQRVAPITLRGEADLVMCGGHRMLVAPEPPEDSGHDWPSAADKIH